MLARAAAEPGTLVLGIDANASGMAEAASRAARISRRRGLLNARFVACAVEVLPGELAHVADLVTVQFPWGSLLRGIVRTEPGVVEPIARLVKPGGELRLLLSVTERDAALGLEALDEPAIEQMTQALEACGLTMIDRRAATAEDLDAARSSWSRRLRAGAAIRPAWLMRFGASDQGSAGPRDGAPRSADGLPSGT